jgi:hypothetical protein
VEAEDDQGFGDDDWEFTAATAEPADQDGGGPGHADGIGKIEVSWRIPRSSSVFDFSVVAQLSLDVWAWEE